MNNISQLDTNILHNLVSARGKLESYTLFKRSKVSFKEFSTSLNRLIVNELIIVEGHNVILSEKGKMSVMSMKPVGYSNKPWRSIPAKYRTQQHPINEPYVPSLSMLDKRTFN